MPARRRSTSRPAGRPASPATTRCYGSGNVTDANQATYWESANNAFPQWVQVDLGSAQSASRVVLQAARRRLGRPQPDAVRPGQHQRHHLLHAGVGRPYTFNPSSSNTVTITFPASDPALLRLNITANTGWPAGQISSLQVWNI